MMAAQPVTRKELQALERRVQRNEKAVGDLVLWVVQLIFPAPMMWGIGEALPNKEKQRKRRKRT